jgi:HSP20 family protein
MAAAVEASMDRLRAILEQGPPQAAGAARVTWSPAVDVFEGPAEIVVIADVPGVPRESLKISFVRGVLFLAGERAASAPEGLGARGVERALGRFARPIPVGPGVRVEDAKARVAGGVLEIRLPKGDPSSAAPGTIEVA